MQPLFRMVFIQGFLQNKHKWGMWRQQTHASFLLVWICLNILILFPCGDFTRFTWSCHLFLSLFKLTASLIWNVYLVTMLIHSNRRRRRFFWTSFSSSFNLDTWSSKSFPCWTRVSCWNNAFLSSGEWSPWTIFAAWFKKNLMFDPLDDCLTSAQHLLKMKLKICSCVHILLNKILEFSSHI